MLTLILSLGAIITNSKCYPFWSLEISTYFLMLCAAVFKVAIVTG